MDQEEDVTTGMYLNEKTIYKLSKKPYTSFIPPHNMTRLQYAYYIFVQFMIFTWKEVSKRKVAFLIGTASCFVVVWMVMISVSALSQIPLVFIRLAELQVGEYDIQISASKVLPGVTLNYTLIDQQIQNATKTDVTEQERYSYHSPRYLFSVKAFTSCNNTLSNDLNYRDYSWMYNSSDVSCGQKSPHQDTYKLSTTDYNDGYFCVPRYCKTQQDRVSLYVIDTDKENRMQFGRNYPYKKLKKGHAIIGASMAMDMGVKAGDTILVGVATMDTLVGPYYEAGIVRYHDQLSNALLNSLEFLPPSLKEAFEKETLELSPELASLKKLSMLHALLEADVSQQTSNFIQLSDEEQYMNRRVTFNNGTLYFPVTIDVVSNNVHGKFATSITDYIIMEFDSFLEHLAEFLPSQLFSEHEKSLMSRVSPYSYAGYVYFNYPPNRLTAYNENDFKKIRDKITDFSSLAMYLIGFNQVDTNFPILEQMQQTQFFSLFVGLIISIILVVLSLLSVVLIYSLLMINVENRRFEMGLLRILGLKRIHLVELILVQAMWYGIPAWMIGLIIGQISYAGVAILLSSTLEAKVSYFASFEAVAFASLLGIGVPILASILPIKTALGQNLHDSLDTQRSVSAVKYSVERAESEYIAWTPVVLGLIGTAFGFGVYYVMPLSLLTFNITIMSYMFMSVILCMLLGLVVLSLNFENMIEFVVVIFTIGIFEKAAVVDLVEKNLIAHRERNRKTTLMFALSLGFIIFSSVLFNTQITAFKYNIMRGAGTNLIVGTRSLYAFSSYPQALLDARIEPTTIPKQVTVPLTNNFTSLPVGEGSTSSYARYSNNLDEYLYTLEGGSQLILGSYFKTRLNVDLNDEAIIETIETTSAIPKYNYALFKVGAFLEASPVALYSSFPRFGTQNILVSVPTYLRLLGRDKGFSVNRLPVDAIFIKLTDSVQQNKQEYRKMKNSLQKVISAYRGPFIRDVNDELYPIEIAVQVMNFFFLFTTLVALIICFFSLVSSMYSNVNEQAKEIGVLRAIGMRKFSIIRVFIYEAFVLITSASISGIFIGGIIGYTMSLQNTLITELPIDFIFPYQIVALVFICAMVFSFLSSFFPIYSLVKMPIVSVLRKLN
ncbi:hypothetical protein C9374_000159 [Naegleria lovaniensis]|uniref:ABC3 transporter permease C-terminal domain-containing protein n=1 Tax=Naegleria lovaniensis TaxID=51637 RepID=A0AA88KM92_NAELO|nr:uncharacterized protein C9374_000159 [Naegleria lovaniensis]KAG2388720.1 hypothetical protein C9374_000159 [Naegleria lovaniensis]